MSTRPPQVNCVSWAPNSLYVASGGLDTGVIIWSVEAPEKHCLIRWQEMGTVLFSLQLELLTVHNFSCYHV